MPKPKKRWAQGKASKADPAIGDLVIARLPRSGIRAVCRITMIGLSEEGEPLYTVMADGATSGAGDLVKTEIEAYRRGPYWPMRVRAGQAATIPTASKKRERVIVRGFYLIGDEAYAAISPAKAGQVLTGNGQALREVEPVEQKAGRKTPVRKRPRAQSKGKA